MPQPPIHLTPRERQHLELIAQGLTVEEISHVAGHSRRTAQFFSDNLRRKLGAKRRYQLIPHALALITQQGLAEQHHSKPGLR